MSHQYLAVAAVIKNTIASVNEILKDPADEMHRIRITGDLQRSHDQLLLLTGSGDLEGQQSTVLGPAKTIGGKPIGKVRRFTADDMIPSDDKVHNLKKQVEAAVLYFGPEASAEGILANIPGLIIRGVAKKAGLKVSKDEPKEITVEFIEQVKKALVAQNLSLKPVEINATLTAEDVKKVAEAIMKPVGPADVIMVDDPLAEKKEPTNDTKPAADESQQEVTDKEAAEFGMNAAKDLYEMVKDIKPGQVRGNKDEPEQPKAEEPKPEPKKKAGK